MKISCFLIMALLATVVVHGASMKSVHEAGDDVATSHGLRGLAARPHGKSTRMWIPVVAGRKVAVGESHIDETSGVQDMNGASKESSPCVTAEECHKKKVICYKKCTGGPGGGVEKNHVPSKCTIVCKKCVPTC